MAQKKQEAKATYCYDRLCEQKLSQAYSLLVPSYKESVNTDSPSSEAINILAYENSSDLYQSILRSTEGE